MHDQRSPHDEQPCEPVAAPADRDRQVQSALLASLLGVYPAQLSTEEIVREMTLDPSDFAECDEIQRAIRDLNQAGLLHRQGQFVMPTQAAVRCAFLFER